MSPKFTVIVPVYNSEAYLKANVESILTQTYTNFEVWLVDDGSTDSSGSLCDAIADKDSRVHVHHQANAGPSAARNYALSQMSGDWVCFMDADDHVSNTWLEHYAMYNNADIIFQGAKVLTGEGRSIFKKMPSLKAEGKDRYNLMVLIPPGVINATWSKCINAEIITSNRLRFDETCNLGEDLIFLLDVLKHSNSIQTIDVQDYCYNRSLSILSNTRYDVETLFHVRKYIVDALDRFFGKDKGSRAYCHFCTHEMGPLYYSYMIQAYKAPRSLRIQIYNWMQSYLRYIDFSRLHWNIRIFSLLYLPTSIFDSGLLLYAYVYNFIHGVIKN